MGSRRGDDAAAIDEMQRDDEGERELQVDWDSVPARMDSQRRYMDDFVAERKRRAYLELVAGWRGDRRRRALKTDLFEEAFGQDSLLPDLSAEFEIAVGIDLALGIAIRARRARAGSHFCCVVTDVRHLPFAADSFDLVLSPSTLDHFRDPDDLHTSLVELRDTLTREGRLVVTLDNRQNVLDPLLRLVIRFGLVPYYVGRSYRIEELVAELEAAGMEVLERTAIVHNPRMLAAASVAVTRTPGLRWLRPAAESCLDAFQRFGDSRWRYYSGCFVAALARRSE